MNMSIFFVIIFIPLLLITILSVFRTMNTVKNNPEEFSTPDEKFKEFGGTLYVPVTFLFLVSFLLACQVIENIDMLLLTMKTFFTVVGIIPIVFTVALLVIFLARIISGRNTRSDAFEKFFSRMLFFYRWLFCLMVVGIIVLPLAYTLMFP